MAFTSGDFGGAKAAPKSTFRFDQNPSQNSGGGVTGKIPWIPPQPAPIGSWRQPPAPAPYQAPYQAPAQPAQGNWNMTGGSAGGGWGNNAAGGSYNGGGGDGGAAAPAPPPRLTSDDFAAKYKGNDKGLALVDSTFEDQSSMFANVLKKYLEDYTRQNDTLGRDAETAQAGIARNKESGLTSQAEDFFARGVGNSGMFATEQDKARDQFDRQKTNVNDSLRDSRADLNFRKSKFEGENGANGSNVQAARRDAYNRLALKQGLV